MMMTLNKRRQWRWILTVATFLLPQAAWPDFNDRVCRILNYACGSTSSSHSGNTYPASSDAVSNNPASVPTDKTPFGIEVLAGNGDMDVSAFQGYGKFGMAAGSIAKEHSFFSNASNLAAAGVTLPGGTGEDINKNNYQLAFAFPMFKSSLQNFIVPYFGVGGRYYKESKNLRESYGLSLSHDYFHFGAGLAKNDSNIGVLSLNGGMKIKKFSFDYTYIKNLKGIPNITRIYSFIYTYKKLTFIGAWRSQETETYSAAERQSIQVQNKPYHRTHAFAGAQLQIGRMLSVGVYFNYLLQRGEFYGFRLALGSY